MKKELIDLLDEVSNPDVIIISSALKTTAAKLLKSINSDALNESPDVNEHEQAKEVCECKVCGKPLDNKEDYYHHYDEYHNKQTD